MKPQMIPFLAAALAAASWLPTDAAASKVLATGEVNKPGVAAEVTECKRRDGTMMVKIRLKNTGDAKQEFYVVKDNRFDDHYVTAGKKKYLMLRDAEKKPIAPSAPTGYISVTLEKGEAWTWWAKFPAPPADVKTIEYTWPLGTPIEDIPCTQG